MSTQNFSLPNSPHDYYLPDVFLSGEASDNNLVVHNLAKDTPAHMSLGFSQHALSVVLAGKKLIQAATQKLTVTPGSALLYRAGAQTLTLDSPDYRSYLVFFTSAELCDFVQAHAVQISSDKPNQSILRISPAPSLKARLAAQHQHEQSFGPPSVRMRKLLLNQILLELLEFNGPQVFSSLYQAAMRDKDSQLQTVLQENWRHDISMSDLAAKANMSRASFARRVKQVYGLSPAEWISIRRLGLAWHLLAFTGKRPSEVAVEVGYTSHSAFAQAFKRHFGISPSHATTSTTQQQLSNWQHDISVTAD